jgi:hypothetical protein
VEPLCDALEAQGLDPWVDRHKLLRARTGGSIEDAIAATDFAIACLSRNSITKKGR